MLETIILILLAGAAFMGLRHGLIRQAGQLAAVVLGITACRLFGHQASAAMAAILPPSMQGSMIGGYTATIVGCMALFIIVGLAVTLAARLVSTITHALMLGPLDRAAGAVFALAECAIVLSVLLNLWLAITPPADTKRYEQGIVAPIVKLAPALTGAHADTGQAEAGEASQDEN